MADKKYSIDFTMSDGSTESVEFVAPQGEKGEDGKSGVYVGSDTPNTDANVWIDPEGSPTGSAEEWTFTLEDGSTVKKTIAVLG